MNGVKRQKMTLHTANKRFDKVCTRLVRAAALLLHR